MYQPIVGYHQDDLEDWVAELGCLHFQHVRHSPPWFNRAWVVNESGRTARIGHQLNCNKCLSDAPADQGTGQGTDELRMPAFMSPYSKTELFTNKSVPNDLLKEHTTENGVWAMLRVRTGTLKFCFSENEEQLVYTIAPEEPRVIVADQPHFIIVENTVSFQLEFYR